MQVLIPHFAKMEQAKTFNASVDRQHALASVRRLPNPDTGSMLGDFPDLDKVRQRLEGDIHIYAPYLVALRTWIRLTLHRQTESLSLALSSLSLDRVRFAPVS